MRPRSLLGPLRIFLVLVGLAVVVGAVLSLATMPEPPPGSDGFPAGLAYGFLFVAATAGLAVVAGGLAIPAPADSPGGSMLRFRRAQRLLAATGLVLLVGSLVLGLGVLLLTNAIVVALAVWFGLGGLGLVAVVAALSWRLVEVALAWAGR